MPSKYSIFNREPLRVIDLVSDDGLKLAVFFEVNVQEFVDSFQKTWKRIPLIDRQSVLEFWKSESTKAPEQPIPAIAIIGTYNGLGGNIDGTAFYYNGVAVDVARQRKGEELVQSIIAHELSHSLQAANGNLVSPTKNMEAVENEADEIVKGWGFAGDYRKYIIECTVLKT